MRGYLDRGYNVVKMKIGGAPLADDLKRIEAVLAMARTGNWPSTPTGASISPPPSPMPKRCRVPLFWYEEAGDPLDFALQAALPNTI